jgi:S1-C subfamily serine protease
MRLQRASLLSGAAGGVLVVALAASILAVAGGLGAGSGTTKVVTVQEAPLVPAAASSAARSLTPQQVYERDAAGVVFVRGIGVTEEQSPSEYLKGEGGQRGVATGSGFEVDGAGTVLTNWHVVENATEVTVGVAQGKTVKATVIGTSPSDDLAVLRIPTAGLTLRPLALGDSRNVRVGEPVLAIGNPFGLERTLTTGIVSALQRKITAPNGERIGDVLQTDAPINPGNSGGPLLDAAGDAIGVNSQIETSGAGGGSVGIGFAVPIDTAKGVLAAAVRRRG